MEQKETRTRIVAGLFESHGIAEDACGRLRDAGVPVSEIAVRVLRETGPIPSTMKSEFNALSVDPLILGDVERTFARFVRNGETVVLVRVADEAAAEAAVNTLRQYAPVAVEVLVPLRT